MSVSLIFLEYDFEEALCTSTSNKILVNFNFARYSIFLKALQRVWGCCSPTSRPLWRTKVADCNLLRKQSSRVSTVVPHKILRKNPDPEYYNNEMKRLKAKVRRVCNKRKLGERYQVEPKSLSKELLAAPSPPKKKNYTGNIFAVSTTK